MIVPSLDHPDLTLDPDSPLTEDAQAFAVDPYVELFQLDVRPIADDPPDPIFYFTSSAKESTAIHWGGTAYTPVPIEATGFAASITGGLPTPKLRLESRPMIVALNAYGDLEGAVLTRYRTLRKYLDGEPEANSEVHFLPDVYVIERKVKQNRKEVEFELRCFLDFEGKKLPMNQMFRDYCPKRYRRWSSATSSFLYGGPGRICPYDGTAYFDAHGHVVSASLDKCGKKLSDCQLRYPGKLPLPYGGFPGMARVRVNG